MREILTRARRPLAAVAAAGAVCAGLAVLHAQRPGEARIAPGDVQWPAPAQGGVGTSGVSGTQTVMLKGDPSKPGIYTMLLRVGPNTRIESHAHGDDRVATVLSGTWYFGYGDRFDESTLKALPAGSVYMEPPDRNHFALTRGEGVIVQITGYGPSSTRYVNPANDPARK